MNMRVIAACGVLLGLAAMVVAAPAPTERKDRRRGPEDIALMHGTWKLVEQGRPGMNANVARLAIRRGDFQTKIRIEGDKFQYLYFNGQDYTPSTTYDLKLQPRSAPKAIDLSYTSGDYTVTLKGIYKLDGNKLTLLYVQNYVSKLKNVRGTEQERPTSFDNPSGTAMQMVLERE